MVFADETTLLFVQVLVFSCATLLTLAAVRSVADQRRLRRRHAGLVGGDSAPLTGSSAGSLFRADPARLGLSVTSVRAMRLELFRAGFFGADAVSRYAMIRVILPAVLVSAGLVLGAMMRGLDGTETILLVAILAAIGIFGPRAYLSRRTRMLSEEYRLLFPNFLDMLVVCVNAGLSLEAALDRAGREMDRATGPFRSQIDLMAGEMRAGKSTVDALKSLAQRLAFREAHSFAALMSQTLELGTDVAQALTTFADEMRDKRMALAEEKAAALPPKLTLPLGLFIFPVVLIVVLAPAIMKVLVTVGR